MLSKICEKLSRKASGMINAENIAGNQAKVEFWKGYRMALTELQCEMAALENVESKTDTSDNSARDEILPLCEQGVRYAEANGLGSVKFIFQQIAEKLSPVA